MLEKIKTGGTVAIIAIGVLILAYGLSWIGTCGIVKLITLCFGFTFKWSIATGIWFILCILRSVFKISVSTTD